MATIKTLSDKYHQLLSSDQSDKYNELRIFYSNLCIQYETNKLNYVHVEEEVLPKLVSKIKNRKEEIETLEMKLLKNESIVHNFKNLSKELETKMENFLVTSKQTQNETHQNREKLTQSFSIRVDEIACRLRNLESKKSLMNEEYFKLQEDLEQCVKDFENQDTIIQSIHSNEDVIEELDESSINEQAAMMYEDYRSNSWKLECQEHKLQNELSQFVDRFQELSQGLTSSNNSLAEHQKRVNELESTLESLENQQLKGKQILLEIKRVIDTETKTCANMRVSIDGMKTKLEKYRNMSKAFETNIHELYYEVERLIRPTPLDHEEDDYYNNYDYNSKDDDDDDANNNDNEKS
jgi:chromosome segregation ATPase